MELMLKKQKIIHISSEPQTEIRTACNVNQWDLYNSERWPSLLSLWMHYCKHEGKSWNVLWYLHNDTNADKARSNKAYCIIFDMQILKCSKLKHENSPEKPVVHNLLHVFCRLIDSLYFSK